MLSLFANEMFARLLEPGDFGLVAMAGVMFGFIDIFKNFGTGAALMGARNPEESLLSSIFWLNCGFGALMTALIVKLSP